MSMSMNTNQSKRGIKAANYLSAKTVSLNLLLYSCGAKFRTAQILRKDKFTQSKLY